MTLKTPYQLTKIWNNAIGNDFSEKLELDTPYTKLCINLLEEEYEKEFKKAIKEGDKKEVIDAIGDIMVCANNILLALGVDGDDLNYEIFNSNMSKLCHRREDVDKSIQSYAEKGRETYSLEVKEGVWCIKDSKTNKTLKGIGFKEPNLSRFL